MVQDAEQPAPMRRQALELWDEQERLRAEVLPKSRPLKATDDRLARIEDRLRDGASADDCRHVLAVYAAEAAADPDAGAKWFNGETNWRPANFDRAVGRPVPTGHKRTLKSSDLDDLADQLEERGL